MSTLMKNMIIPTLSIFPVMLVGLFDFNHINLLVLGVFILCLIHFLMTVFYIFQVTVNHHRNEVFFEYLKSKDFLQFNLIVIIVGTLNVYMVGALNGNLNNYLLLIYYVSFMFSRSALYLLVMRIHGIEYERKMNKRNDLLRRFN